MAETEEERFIRIEKAKAQLKNKKRKPVKDPREQPLTDMQKAFVNLYTNPESPGFCNATEATRILSPDSKFPNQAGMIMRKKPHVDNAIKQRLEEHGFGQDSRLKTLSDIGNGILRYQQEFATKHGIVALEVRPSIRERLAAIELANKMDGTYSQQKLDADIARDEAAQLRRKILRDVTGS